MNLCSDVADFSTHQEDLNIFQFLDVDDMTL